MKLLIWALLLKAHIAAPEIVYRQALLETASFHSRLCVKHNNLFGIKKGSHYAHFDSYQACVLYYASHISTRYHGGNYYTFLRRIGYAADRRYCAKLRKINPQLMRYAIVLNSTKLGPVAYLTDSMEIAPLKSIHIQLCCGEPVNCALSITPDGKLSADQRCCGGFRHQLLLPGDSVSGQLVQDVFHVDRYNGPAPRREYPHAFDSSTNLADNE